MDPEEMDKKPCPFCGSTNLGIYYTNRRGRILRPVGEGMGTVERERISPGGDHE